VIVVCGGLVVLVSAPIVVLIGYGLRGIRQDYLFWVTHKRLMNTEWSY